MNKDVMQEILLKAAQSLDGMLPNNIRCVVVFGDLETGEVAAISDLSEDAAVALAKAGVSRLENPEGMRALDLDKDSDDSDDSEKKILH